MLAPNQLAPLANRLAESLCSEDGLAAFRLMVQLQNLSAAPSRRAETNAEDTARRCVRVGIWERQEKNGAAAFVRTSGKDAWPLWADVQEIPAKTAKQRVVLIGESVARGFYYDPDANSASVLQAMLRAAVAADDIEVIDLARTDLQLKPLLELAESAVALEPDALVIFGGNNWHPISGLGPADLREIARLIGGGQSWKEVKTYLERRLREQVRFLLAGLSRISKQHNLPVLILIPEFNLLDWRSDSDGPALLNDADLLAWLKTRQAAEQALADGRLTEAERLAQSLSELDGGTTPDGFNLLSAVKRQAGVKSGLRQILEQARDAGISLPRHQTPRCFSTIQEVLRQEAAAHGLTVVDLPQRFEQYLDGDLPGRRLFLDYCHLTLEGMRVAMAAAAAPLLAALSRTTPTWQSLVATEFAVSDKVMAEASFLAAVHNANWGNSAELVHFHLAAAIKQHPPVATLMRQYLDFHLRRAPSPLCNTFEQMARTANFSLISLLFRSPRTEKNINFGLVKALVEVLAPMQPDIREDVQELLIAEHATTGPRNLLQKLYCGTATEQKWDQDRYAYYRASRRRSEFMFVCHAPAETELRITSRSHLSGNGEEIEVWVNDTSLHRFNATTRWQNVVFKIPAQRLAKGINKLEIVWPETGWAYPERAAEIGKALEAGRVPEVGPIYGELHTLLITSLHAARPLPLGHSLPAAEAMAEAVMA